MSFLGRPIDVEKTMVSWKMIIDSWLFHIVSLEATKRKKQIQTDRYVIIMNLGYTLHVIYIYIYNIYIYDVIALMFVPMFCRGHQVVLGA